MGDAIQGEMCAGASLLMVLMVLMLSIPVSALLIPLLLCASFALGCLTLGALVKLARREPRKIASFVNTRNAEAILQRTAGHFSAPLLDSAQTRRVVISHNVDKALKEVFDYSYRDYLLSWYGPLCYDEGQLYHLLLEDFWETVRQLRSRLAEVDLVNLICCDVARTLHTHFCNLKAATTGQEETPHPFPLHPCLRSPEEELRFLRSCARLLLLGLMPARHARSRSLRAVLAEVLAVKVLKPVVEALSDPDYINRTLLVQLEQREQLSERHRKAYTYAPSYEDFIKLISGSSDIEFLKQLRYQIVVEIIQATAISNLPQLKKLKDGKGKESAAMKADLLRARNMKRYINQLTVAKRRCEKRIRLLGGPDYEQEDDGAADEGNGTQNQKVLQFEEVMSKPALRQHFRVYMERVDKRALISFWESVETLKSASKTEVPQLVGEIYQNFFVESREIVVEKNLYKEIQQTLVGNRGTDVFSKIQSDVYETMKDRYYPSFLVSDLFGRVTRQQEKRSDSQSSSDDKDEGVTDSGEENLDEGRHGISEQASHAVSKLQQLHDKLEYKRQALGSIQNSPKLDKKIASKLKEEIGVMEREQADLQEHISRTDWWCENLGRWRANVGSGEATEENGEQVPCYCVGVSLLENEQSDGSSWSVSRRLSEFHALHRKLAEGFPSLKKVQLPATSKLPFKSIDQKFLDKSKIHLNTFLEKVLSDEKVCQSEALYAFLSPSPEHLKSIDSQKKSSFTLASFLERLPGDLFSHPEEDAEYDSDFSDYGDESDGKRDAVAEPCFILIGEIFELRGMFKWVRKTLIALVQVTFGGTINKQIRDTIHWMFSEQMLTYYSNIFRDAFWPDGKLAVVEELRSDSERRETKEKARQKLLDSIPDALQSLVGQQNARHGIIKIFNALQESNANRHLLYVLFELLLKELCPELNAEMKLLPAGVRKDTH